MTKKRRHFKCPKCNSKKTIKKGARRGLRRYQCKDCLRWFSIDYRRKDPVLWIPYVDGISFRRLANEHGLSHAEAFTRVKDEMNKLPDSNWVTVAKCNHFSGTLIIDGKYIKVRGYKEKIPFIYGLDYPTHDILVSLLAPSENEEAFLKFFRILKTAKFPLRIVVCDDRSSLIPALNYHYPKALVQLCHNHYLENIRETLRIRTDQTHRKFFDLLVRRVFHPDVSLAVRNLRLHELYMRTAQYSAIRQSIIVGIYRRRKELFNYTHIPNCPKDTNLIELFNSHLQPRLKPTKGFKSFQDAERFLNALVLRRRTLPFTDCAGKFKHLNGKTSLQMTLKKQTDWPELIPRKSAQM